MSTVLEGMIEDARRARELTQLNANIASFYDSLPETIVREQAAWGAVGAFSISYVGGRPQGQ